MITSSSDIVAKQPNKRVICSLMCYYYWGLGIISVFKIVSSLDWSLWKALSYRYFQHSSDIAVASIASPCYNICNSIVIAYN